MNRKLLASSGLALLTTAALADVRYGVTAGVGHSSNIERVEQGEISETIASVGLDLDWEADSRRLEGQAAIDLQYLEYLDDTFDSEVTGTADANLRLRLVPEYVDWNFRDSFGQATSDPFSPTTAETRENINFFSTGPTIGLRLGSAASLRFMGELSLIDYEESPLDGERRTYGVALERRPSERSSISLNAVMDDVMFDQAPANDYQRRSAFLGYEIEGARTELAATLGYSEIEPESGDSDDGLLASLRVSRRMTNSSTLDLRLGTQLMDAADALRQFAAGGVGGDLGGGGGGIATTADPFENREISLTYRLARRRTELVVAGAQNQNRYFTNAALDRDRTVLSANVNRMIGQRFTLGLIASLTEDEFLAIDAEAEELNYGAVMQYRVGESLSLRLTVDRFDRDTSSGLGEYGENRAWLSLRWQRPGAGGAGGAP